MVLKQTSHGVSVIVCPPLFKENNGRACWTVALNIDTEINNFYGALALALKSLARHCL